MAVVCTPSSKAKGKPESAAICPGFAQIAVGPKGAEPALK